MRLLYQIKMIYIMPRIILVFICCGICYVDYVTRHSTALILFISLLDNLIRGNILKNIEKFATRGSG